MCVCVWMNGWCVAARPCELLVVLCGERVREVRERVSERNEGESRRDSK